MTAGRSHFGPLSFSFYKLDGGGLHCALEVMRLVLLVGSYDKVVAYGSERGCWELLSSPRAYYTGIVELRRSRYALLSAGCSLYLTMGPEAGLEALGTMTFSPSICVVSCPHRDMSDSVRGQEPAQHSLPHAGQGHQAVFLWHCQTKTKQNKTKPK
ncbi:hypothetical protein P7K49_029642, partial [Saguinus oedipus]